MQIGREAPRRPGRSRYPLRACHEWLRLERRSHRRAVRWCRKAASSRGRLRSLERPGSTAGFEAAFAGRAGCCSGPRAGSRASSNAMKSTAKAWSRARSTLATVCDSAPQLVWKVPWKRRASRSARPRSGTGLPAWERGASTRRARARAETPMRPMPRQAVEFSRLQCQTSRRSGRPTGFRYGAVDEARTDLLPSRSARSRDRQIERAGSGTEIENRTRAPTWDAARVDHSGKAWPRPD